MRGQIQPQRAETSETRLSPLVPGGPAQADLTVVREAAGVPGETRNAAKIARAEREIADGGQAAREVLVVKVGVAVMDGVQVVIVREG